MSTVSVTDHAVLRYLERRHGLDVNAVRLHLAGLAYNAAALGALAVKVEGVKLVLTENTIVTVLHRRWPVQVLR